MGNSLDKVLPDVYIGSMAGADKECIDSHKITHVVSVCEKHKYIFDGVSYLLIEVDDVERSALSIHFDKALAFIHGARKDGGIVLIHCMAGISRSSTVTLAYLMAATGLSLDECFAALKSARSCVRPNEGFWKQLKAFEKNELEAARAKLQPLPSREEDEACLKSLIAQAKEPGTN